MSVEFWKSVFDWGAVVLVGLTFIAGAGALITGKILSDRQQARAEALETSNLQLRIDLERSAAESRERQTELELEQQKTAEAQQKAAEVQLALRKAVEQAAAPRRIVLGSRNNDQEIRQARFAELEKYKDTPAIIVFVQDEEATILAADIKSALQKSGWKSVSVVDLASTPIPLGYIQEGVQVRTLHNVEGKVVPAVPAPGMKPPEVVDALISLLNLDLGPPVGSPFGVRWDPDVIINGNPIGLIRYGFRIPDGGVVITVGRKPTEQFFWGIPDLPSPKKRQ